MNSNPWAKREKEKGLKKTEPRSYHDWKSKSQSTKYKVKVVCGFPSGSFRIIRIIYN